MRIKLDPDAICPTRAHATDAGLDLYARHEQHILPFSSAVFLQAYMWSYQRAVLEC